MHLFQLSVQFSSVTQSHPTLRPHGLQQASPSPTTRVCPNSPPLSRWCHPTISSSVVPFSSHLQSFPTSRSYQISLLLASGGQSIGVSVSASVLPMNTQDWSPLGWTPYTPRDSQESSPTPQFKSINSLVLSFLYSSTLNTWFKLNQNRPFKNSVKSYLENRWFLLLLHLIAPFGFLLNLKKSNGSS